MTNINQPERKYRKRRNPEYLSAVQVARRYGFHRNTPANWCRDRIIPFTVGTRGEYLIKEGDVEDFIRKWYENWFIILAAAQMSNVGSAILATNSGVGNK